MEEKVNTAKQFAEKIKNKEFQLTFDNTSEEDKDKIGKEIFELGEEQNKVYDEIEKKYEQKLNDAKEELKNQSIQNMEWIKNLKEKYISDIDSTIYNFIGN
jgi:TRAP-type C4-dicarboxylate transport system substrate-binding protein